MINYFNQRRGRYLVVKKTFFLRALGQPLIRIIVLPTLPFDRNISLNRSRRAGKLYGLFPEAFFKASKLSVSLARARKLSRPGLKKNEISTHQDSIYLGCPTQVWILVFFVWEGPPQGGVPYHKESDSYFKVNAYD